MPRPCCFISKAFWHDLKSGIVLPLPFGGRMRWGGSGLLWLYYDFNDSLWILGFSSSLRTMNAFFFCVLHFFNQYFILFIILFSSGAFNSYKIKLKVLSQNLKNEFALNVININDYVSDKYLFLKDWHMPV